MKSQKPTAQTSPRERRCFSLPMWAPVHLRRAEQWVLQLSWALCVQGTRCEPHSPHTSCQDAAEDRREEEKPLAAATAGDMGHGDWDSPAADHLASARLGVEGLKVTKNMTVFPLRIVTFAFWQRVGPGPAMGHGLWGATRPPPGSGHGRSACSSTGTTSAEGPSSPRAGSSQLPTVSTSKSLNRLAQGVPLTVLVTGLGQGGHCRVELKHSAFS